MKFRPQKRQQVDEFAIGRSEGTAHSETLMSREEVEHSIEFFEAKRDECRRMMFDSGERAADGILSGLRSRLQELETTTRRS